MSLFLLSSSGIPDNLISIETATLTRPYTPKADLVFIRLEEKYGALAGKREGKEEEKKSRAKDNKTSNEQQKRQRSEVRFAIHPSA